MQLSNNIILRCYILASYICTYCLFSEVWASPYTCYIPAHLSSQLLRQLQNTEHDQLWIGNEDMLLWVLMAGATSSQPGVARSSTQYCFMAVFAIASTRSSLHGPRWNRFYNNSFSRVNGSDRVQRQSKLSIDGI